MIRTPLMVISDSFHTYDLKFVFESVDEYTVLFKLRSDSFHILFAPIVNLLKHGGKVNKVSAEGDYLDIELFFKDENCAVKFTQDFLVQKLAGSSSLAVIDKKNNQIICAGIVTGVKHSDPIHKDMSLVTMDSKHYFHIQGNEKYVLKWYDGPPIPFEDPYGYVILPWQKSSLNEPSTIDVYRDFSYYELDPEVEPLVHALNKIPGLITTGSCCGHDISTMYVSMIIYTISALSTLMNILSDINSPYFEKFNLHLPLSYMTKHNSPPKKDIQLDGKSIITSNYSTIFKDRVSITLYSVDKGKAAYEYAEELAKDICERMEGDYE